jgi:site-specific DNA-adenine methylase
MSNKEEIEEIDEGMIKLYKEIRDLTSDLQDRIYRERSKEKK